MRRIENLPLKALSLKIAKRGKRAAILLIAILGVSRAVSSL